MEQIPHHKTPSNEMSIADRKIILCLTDGRLQFLRGERCARQFKNASDGLRRTNKRGKFLAIFCLPSRAELLKTDTIGAPQCQFLAVIAPTFLSHCAARIYCLKERLNVSM